MTALNIARTVSEVVRANGFVSVTVTINGKTVSASRDFSNVRAAVTTTGAELNEDERGTVGVVALLAFVDFEKALATMLRRKSR